MSVELLGRNIVAPASQNRIPALNAVLVRPYPGGYYDSGDMWVIADDYGREHVGAVSESMMGAL